MSSSIDNVAVFVKVVQAGSFSAAAKLLDMPNSTVSAKVASLERELGVTLLQRTTRTLHVTSIGESYFRRCVHALEEIQLAEAEIAGAQKEPQGTLRITVPVDIGHSLLPKLIKAYLQRFPHMHVDLIVSNRVVDLIAEGVDIAIRAGDLKDSSLISKKIQLEDATLWASPSYLNQAKPIKKPEDLMHHDFLWFKPFKKSGAIELRRKNEIVSISPPSKIIADDLYTLKNLVQLGLGISILPRYLCEEEHKNKLLQVLPEWLVPLEKLSFVYPSQKFIPPKVREFLRVAEEL